MTTGTPGAADAATQPGRWSILNGGPRSGKTSIAQAMQQHTDAPGSTSAWTQPPARLPERSASGHRPPPRRASARTSRTQSVRLYLDPLRRRRGRRPAGLQRRGRRRAPRVILATPPCRRRLRAAHGRTPRALRRGAAAHRMSFGGDAPRRGVRRATADRHFSMPWLAGRSRSMTSATTSKSTRPRRAPPSAPNRSSAGCAMGHRGRRSAHWPTADVWDSEPAGLRHPWAVDTASKIPS